MPKMKTHKGAAKRLRKTGKGKFKYKSSGARHGLRRRGKGARREDRQNSYVHDSQIGMAHRLLPNG